MAVDIDFQTLIDNTLSVTAQVSEYVDFAIESELAGLLIDERILGRIVNVKTYVDGTLSKIDTARKTIDAVRSLANVITFDFQITEEVLNFISVELYKHSPYKSGNYVRGHVLFADGVLVEDVSKAPNAAEFLFVNTVPYSLKIEAGESSMAPNGVYEIVANLANKKYGNSIRIEYFDYIGTFGVMAQIPNSTYGRHTTLQMNKSQNRFPAIRVVV